ncbi:alpha/beta hydrolase [bacterium]|nr:alpha/beta hydrolase [bacterium]
MQTVVNGVLTNYEIINPKQTNTLVILHGWGSSISYWVPLTKLLTPKVRIILVDLPGFGSTGPLPDKPDVPEYTNFVRNFTQKLNLKNFILAGHSFGGQITLDYALKYPEDPNSIVLIAPAAIRERSKFAQAKIKLAKIIKPIFVLLPNSSFEKFLGWYTPKDYSNSNEYQKKVLGKIVVYNLKSYLGEVRVPTDIIWGSEDFVIPNMGKYLAENIHDSHLYIVYGANHLIHFYHLQKLADIINQIIAKRYV